MYNDISDFSTKLGWKGMSNERKMRGKKAMYMREAVAINVYSESD